MHDHDPEDRPALRAGDLIRCLARFDVRWVLCGSQVLALHGAKFTPNDLDVVPDLTPENLERVAACLEDLGATAAYLEGWGGARGTMDACKAWRPWPATAENLDWLFVTRFGMLDIVIKKADSYAALIEGATWEAVDGAECWVCDPRKVLAALEGRRRAKDHARRAAYREMRQVFGMPDELGEQGSAEPMP
ncbi:hypothetical protein [Maritimibacter dapengensis]|uniref:Nucleotidyltransferase n=1 Tax=Maritimibacter dapengensis TaxID=2836868 RepID=A0ABS6T1F0_9RHOB|nr:hypothetical protein [Maritimibacter dapengensis]MBV7379058.1 hypothetical protein [Maritimibacter dapengensis]